MAVIRAALAEANLKPADVTYVETHGTGTSLGDPIEVQALAEALGLDHSQEQPLMIGSVKTNIGHLESAAGVAGLIKLILSLQHREIPPHLHLKALNPYIAWEQMPISVPTGRTPWRPVNGRWIGGLSSFGFSGTNVHILVEAAPEEVKKTTAAPNQPLHMLRLSARTQPALQEQARQLEQHLAQNAELQPCDVSFTINTGRGTFNHRLALSYTTLSEAREKLAAAAEGNEDGAVRSGVAKNRRPKTVFLFTGNGAQWMGMGRKLYENQRVFREALDACSRLFKSYLPEPLVNILYHSGDSTELFNKMVYTQAATFAIQYALVQLWRSWGVVPDLMIGHSQGEYAAAVTAGVFSLEDGVRLVAARGRLLELAHAAWDYGGCFCS